jgi:uridine kinase
MNPRPAIIAIAGCSCSGKTALAHGLVKALAPHSVTYFSLDAYYNDLAHLSLEDRALNNFDAPQALDWPLLRQHVQTLAEGRPIDAPLYDFTSHTRKAETELISPGRFILLEGLFALYDETLRNLNHHSVYVDTPDKICLARRLDRDVRERGRTEVSVQQQYANTVRPMALEYVIPTMQYAKEVVEGTCALSETIELVRSQILALPAS